MIPAELIACEAWVTWRYEDRGGSKPTKVPYNVRTGLPTDVRDANAWATFEICTNGAAENYHGKGFVLHDGLPYSGIDFDDPFLRKDGTYVQPEHVEEYTECNDLLQRNLEIVRQLDSYTEFSPSGRGLHVIVRGKVPRNLKVRALEVYSRDRYLTMTGHHFAGTPLEIQDRQYALDELFSKIEGTQAQQFDEVADSAETRPDADCIAFLMSNSNAGKFAALWGGDMSAYSSGSEADLALADFICFATDNKEQAIRLFKQSAHYARRAKLHDAHGEYLIKRVVALGFDRKVPPVDFTALAASMDRAREAYTAPEIKPNVMPRPERPPGLVGELADFLFLSAPRPTQEIALAAAIGFMAGVCGRAFNVNGMGLNQYIALLCYSGAGKEAMSGGLNRLIAGIAETMPAAHRFIGPSVIASAPALYKCFDDKSNLEMSFMSFIPEIGKWLKANTQQNAASYQVQLIGAILDIYSKSGHTNVVNGLRYSDSDKNVGNIHAPAFSFIGDSVPSKFYEAVTEDGIEQGLIPRMLIIEYTGDRPPLNESASRHVPTFDFVEKIKQVMVTAMQHHADHRVTNVRMTDDAAAFFREFSTWADAKYNGTADNTIKAIWSRTHQKALKLAGLIAVGCNWYDPTIMLENAQYAKAFAIRDAEFLIRAYRGEDDNAGIGAAAVAHGGGERSDRAHRAIAKQMAKVLFSDHGNSTQNFVKFALAGYVTLSKLVAEAKKYKPFKGHRLGDQTAIMNALRQMIEIGCIGEVQENDPNMKAKLGYADNRKIPKGYFVADDEQFRALIADEPD